MNGPSLWFRRDERLAALAARGDEQAFTRLYQRYHPQIHGFFARRLKPGEDVDELQARVFLRMIEKLSTFNADRGGFRPWLFAIARNMLTDHRRTTKQPANGSTASLASHATALEDLLRQEQRDQVQSLIAAYSPQTQEILCLRFGDGLGHREIAQVMGLTTAAVKQRVSRAVRDLRSRVADDNFAAKAGDCAT